MIESILNNVEKIVNKNVSNVDQEQFKLLQQQLKNIHNDPFSYQISNINNDQIKSIKNPQEEQVIIDSPKSSDKLSVQKKIIPIKHKKPQSPKITLNSLDQQLRDHEISLNNNGLQAKMEDNYFILENKSKAITKPKEVVLSPHNTKVISKAELSNKFKSIKENTMVDLETNSNQNSNNDRDRPARNRKLKRDTSQDNNSQETECLEFNSENVQHADFVDLSSKPKPITKLNQTDSDKPKKLQSETEYETQDFGRTNNHSDEVLNSQFKDINQDISESRIKNKDKQIENEDDDMSFNRKDENQEPEFSNEILLDTNNFDITSTSKKNMKTMVKKEFIPTNNNNIPIIMNLEEEDVDDLFGEFDQFKEMQKQTSAQQKESVQQKALNSIPDINQNENNKKDTVIIPSNNDQENENDMVDVKQNNENEDQEKVQKQSVKQHFDQSNPFILNDKKSDDAEIQIAEEKGGFKNNWFEDVDQEISYNQKNLDKLAGSTLIDEARRIAIQQNGKSSPSQINANPNPNLPDDSQANDVEQEKLLEIYQSKPNPTQDKQSQGNDKINFDEQSKKFEENFNSNRTDQTTNKFIEKIEQQHNNRYQRPNETVEENKFSAEKHQKVNLGESITKIDNESDKDKAFLDDANLSKLLDKNIKNISKVANNKEKPNETSSKKQTMSSDPMDALLDNTLNNLSATSTKFAKHTEELLDEPKVQVQMIKDTNVMTLLDPQVSGKQKPLENVEFTIEEQDKSSKEVWVKLDIGNCKVELKNRFKQLKKAKKLNLNVPMLQVILDKKEGSYLVVFRCKTSTSKYFKHLITLDSIDNLTKIKHKSIQHKLLEAMHNFKLLDKDELNDLRIIVNDI